MAPTWICTYTQTTTATHESSQSSGVRKLTVKRIEYTPKKIIVWEHFNSVFISKTRVNRLFKCFSLEFSIPVFFFSSFSFCFTPFQHSLLFSYFAQFLCVLPQRKRRANVSECVFRACKLWNYWLSLYKQNHIKVVTIKHTSNLMKLRHKQTHINRGNKQRI